MNLRTGLMCLGPELLEDPRVCELSCRAWRSYVMALGLAVTDEQAAANVAAIAERDPAAHAEITGGQYPAWPNARWRDVAHFRRDVWSKRNVDATYARDGRACRYCGRSDGRLSIDHLLPRSRGGDDEIENLVVACVPCNSRKKDRTPDEAGMVLLPVPSRRTE